jgi:hypothetical protein
VQGFRIHGDADPLLGEKVVGDLVNACSIASHNYLAFAATLAASYRRYHPAAEVFVCIVDEPADDIDYAALPFVTVFAGELGIRKFHHMAFRYNLVELCTAVKPYFLEYLHARFGLEKLLYFDPDVWVMRNVAELHDRLSGARLLLTPHITDPLPRGVRPTERAIRMAGIYNLGFLGIRFDPQTSGLLHWWKRRLEHSCRHAAADGVFVDQSWMDFAPAFVDDVGILRDPGYNVAYWNLAQRPLTRTSRSWQVQGRDIAFFHFSGFDPCAAEGRFTRHESDGGLDADRLLGELSASYVGAVRAAGHASFARRPCAYSSFRGNAVELCDPLRQTLASVDPHGERWPDPFETDRPGSFYDWLTEPIPLGGCRVNRALLSL